jgi:hypothetical protein
LANTDVLNPNTGWSDGLGFNPNWSYGSPSAPGNNYTTVKPRFGAWNTRTTGDAGYTYKLTFVGPIELMRYLQTFYRQFSRGFFTLIDYDDDSREHVGRFTSYSDNTQNRNSVYTANVVFEDIPGCPMRNYPADFTKWGYPIYVVDDWINTLVGTQGAAWVAQQTPVAVTAAISTSDPSSYEMYDPGAVAGDFACIEYVGWGFSIPFRSGTNLGLCNLFVDGVEVATGIDLYAMAVGSTFGTVTVSLPGTPITVGGHTFTHTSLILQIAQMSLGTHRVKIVATGTANAGSSSTGIIFPPIQVIG